VDWELSEDGVEGLLRRWVASRSVALRSAGAVASRAFGIVSHELTEQREDTTAFERRGDGPERSAWVGRGGLDGARGVLWDSWT
jgi:hypothetical protein